MLLKRKMCLLLVVFTLISTMLFSTTASASVYVLLTDFQSSGDDITDTERNLFICKNNNFNFLFSYPVGTAFHHADVILYKQVDGVFTEISRLNYVTTSHSNAYRSSATLSSQGKYRVDTIIYNSNGTPLGSNYYYIIYNSGNVVMDGYTNSVGTFPGGTFTVYARIYDFTIHGLQLDALRLYKYAVPVAYVSPNAALTYYTTEGQHRIYNLTGTLDTSFQNNSSGEYIPEIAVKYHSPSNYNTLKTRYFSGTPVYIN